MVDRPKYTILLDVRFGSRYGEMNERFYRRLDLLFGFVGLFFGSAVVVGVVGSYPAVSVTSGILVAACAVIERLVRPVEKAIEHGAHKKRFAELDSRASKLSAEEIDAELKLLQADAPNGIESLSIPAFNANLRSNGREEMIVEESTWQKAVSLLA